MDEVRTAEQDAGGLPFTDAARRLIADARAESDRLMHGYIGTEHLTLALVRQSGDAASLLRLGVDWEQVRALITEIIEPGQSAPVPGRERPFTSRTKRAIALAGASAHALGHAAVGLEHLVLGLMREGVCIAAQTLSQHGLTEERALEQVQQSDAETFPSTR